MKKQDILISVIIVSLFLPFLISGPLYGFYVTFNSEHGFITSFLKFAILATVGEVLGHRVRSGGYNLKGFGLVPRMVTWGLLGITIKAAFMIFSTGAPAILAYLGMEDPSGILAGPLSLEKIPVAFAVSLTLNLTFSPVLMTFHRITDAHIQQYGGTVKCFTHPVRFRYILSTIDWNMHWGFILKKTIPLFWIPAHTVTFMLPVDFQILFAAVLGIALGLILAFAAPRNARE